MKQWLFFIIGPFFAMTIVALILTFISGGILQLSPGGFWSFVEGFIEFFILISTAYQLCPPNTNKVTLTIFYGVICTVLGWLILVVDKDASKFFTWGQEIGNVAGLIFGIIGVIEMNKTEKKQEI